MAQTQRNPIAALLRMVNRQGRSTADRINGGSKEQDEVTGKRSGKAAKGKDQSGSRQAENDQRSRYTVLGTISDQKTESNTWNCKLGQYNTLQRSGFYVCVKEVQVCVQSVQCRCIMFGVISPGRCLMGNVVQVNLGSVWLIKSSGGW